uniref:Uncharacterized protein n=1 Tax=Arundo donax TaxID=35708 RepID=A0A0A9ESA9_ARUDO
MLKKGAAKGAPHQVKENRSPSIAQEITKSIT